MPNFRSWEPDFFHVFKSQLAILSAAVNVQPFSNLDPDVPRWATRKWKMTEARIASISPGQHSIACGPCLICCTFYNFWSWWSRSHADNSYTGYTTLKPSLIIWLHLIYFQLFLLVQCTEKLSSEKYHNLFAHKTSFHHFWTIESLTLQTLLFFLLHAT